MNPFLEHVKKHIALTEFEEVMVLSKLAKKTFLKGQYIVQNGDIGKSQSFILSGTVRTFFLDANGNEHIVAFGIEDWWVGDLGSFISQEPADFNIQCLEKTEVLQILPHDLEQLYKDVPKMERFYRLIIQKAYAASQKRIIRNYSLPAQDRYLLFCEEHPEIVQRVPQYMIASYLGITKEFLSTLKKRIADSARS